MFRDFINLFFPNSCLACKLPLVQGEAWLCAYCTYAMPQTDDHRLQDNIVAKRLYGRLPIKQAMALYLFRKDSAIQKLLHALKYARQPEIGIMLGKRYGVRLQQETQLLQTLDLIVPVPLHTTRLRERGYNQSDLFAQGLATSLGIPWNNQGLRRIRATATQTKRDRASRFKNVYKAFASNSQAVYGKRILLVDDIVTTGATLEACGATLLAAGAREISIATVAVTDDRV